MSSGGGGTGAANGGAGSSSGGLGRGSSEGGASGAGDAAAGSAGSSGAASGDAAGASAVQPCGSNAILCEDFEQYAAASAPGGEWTASQRGNGKVVVDTTRAFSGQQALRVSGRLNADRANISRPVQTDSATAYVRLMLYATSYPGSSGVHTRLLRIGTAQAASGNPGSSYALATYNGTAIEKVNSIYQRDTTTQLDDPALLSRWTCWEFAIDKSGGVGNVSVQLWLDGQELTLKAAGSSSHGMTSPSWDPIPFELVMLGLDGFQADTQAADFWIDDISITPQRVGCRPVTP